MREAVIVSTARTPIGKAYRGAFNNTPSQTLAGHAIEHAVSRAGIDPAEVDDVIMGAALQQGVQGSNIGRQAALKGGLPVTVSGMPLDRGPWNRHTAMTSLFSSPASKASRMPCWSSKMRTGASTM